MPIATITSDFGLDDYYLALIKGALLCQQADLRIVDISHNIRNYDIVQAAFVLKNTYQSFPKGSIHLLSVNNRYRSDASFLAIRHDGHYFVGPDNGVFYLMFGEDLKDVYEIEVKASSNFPIREIFATAIGHLAQGLPINEIGEPLEEVEKRISIQAVTGPAQIRGSVIHIDNYENCILNIPRSLFEQVGRGRPFHLTFKRHQPLTRLQTDYAEVAIGEPLCLFNSAELLEIAINLGKAASMLGLRIEDGVQIDFLDK